MKSPVRQYVAVNGNLARATGLTNETKKRKWLSRPRVMMLAGVLLLAILAGAAVQLGIVTQFFANEDGELHTPAVMERRELAVGRIVTRLRTAGPGQVSNLILDPVIAYEVAAGTPPEAPGLTPKTAELRDSFIDYLAGVGIDEISGSAGIATLKAELLRRARLVAGDGSPQAVLLQEFILQ